MSSDTFLMDRQVSEWCSLRVYIWPLREGLSKRLRQPGQIARVSVAILNILTALAELFAGGETSCRRIPDKAGLI